MKRYLAWRIGRREYALALAVYFAGYFSVYYLVSTALAEMALPLIWVLALAVPRLRDIGWSAWLSVAPFGAGFAVGFLSSVVERASGQPWPAGNVLAWIVGVASLAFMLLIAFKRPRVDTVEVFG